MAQLSVQLAKRGWYVILPRSHSISVCLCAVASRAVCSTAPSASTPQSSCRPTTVSYRRSSRHGLFQKGRSSNRIDHSKKFSESGCYIVGSFPGASQKRLRAFSAGVSLPSRWYLLRAVRSWVLFSKKRNPTNCFRGCPFHGTEFNVVDLGTTPCRWCTKRVRV